MTALAAQAAKNALEMAKVDPDDVDLVLLCTSTPEDLFGSAPQVLFFSKCFHLLKPMVFIYQEYFDLVYGTEQCNVVGHEDIINLRIIIKAFLHFS